MTPTDEALRELVSACLNEHGGTKFDSPRLRMAIEKGSDLIARLETQGEAPDTDWAILLGSAIVPHVLPIAILENCSDKINEELARRLAQATKGEKTARRVDMGLLRKAIEHGDDTYKNTKIHGQEFWLDCIESAIVNSGVLTRAPQALTTSQPQIEQIFWMAAEKITGAINAPLTKEAVYAGLRAIHTLQLTAPQVPVSHAHAGFVNQLYEVRMEPDKLIILIQLEKQRLERSSPQLGIPKKDIEAAVEFDRWWTKNRDRFPAWSIKAAREAFYAAIAQPTIWTMRYCDERI